MGWLFAVARGMQEHRGARGRWSLPPIALGHALAIGAWCWLQRFSARRCRWRPFATPVAAVLVGLGSFTWCAHRHPRWVGMQVGFRDLTVWSFLMASAHGAGLMVLPVVLGSSTVEAHAHMAGHSHMASTASPLTAMLATGIHTVDYICRNRTGRLGVISETRTIASS